MFFSSFFLVCLSVSLSVFSLRLSFFPGLGLCLSSCLTQEFTTYSDCTVKDWTENVKNKNLIHVTVKHCYKFQNLFALILHQFLCFQIFCLVSRVQLALESRLESLHQILKKMESCEKPASSESLNKQGQSAERCSSNSSSNQSTAASAPPRDDNWLMACGSDELIQVKKFDIWVAKNCACIVIFTV